MAAAAAAAKYFPLASWTASDPVGEDPEAGALALDAAAAGGAAWLEGAFAAPGAGLAAATLPDEGGAGDETVALEGARVPPTPPSIVTGPKKAKAIKVKKDPDDKLIEWLLPAKARSGEVPNSNESIQKEKL